MNLRLLMLVPVALLTGCSENAFNPATVNEVVVDGCLIAGIPVDSIRISPLLPYGGDSATSKPITDAVVSISNGNSTWSLTPWGDSGYCGDTAFLPGEGETYTLSLSYGGKNISASTTVPEKPAGLSLSSDTMIIDTTITEREMMQDQRNGGTIPEIALTFKNPDAAYFYVVVQNVDSAPVAWQADTDTVMFRGGTRFLSSPFKDTGYVITFAQIKDLGRHKVTLYRVNQEYVDLYDYRTQDSRNLNEPKTNVVNGLGIFTAVNCDSIFFYAVASQ